MYDTQIIFGMALFFALLLLQIPWMLRLATGIGDLILAVQSAINRRRLEPQAQKQLTVSQTPSPPNSFERERSTA
jgi:hypothetical protein